MRKISVAFTLLFLSIFIGCTQNTHPPSVPLKTNEVKEFTGKVIKVLDGDTVTVLRGKESVKIRLWGIDTPERKQAFGTKAKKFTSKLVFGKIVTVEEKDIGRYGRVVGVVKLSDGTNLNQELVKNGFAWWYRQFAKKDKTLPKLEEEARKARRGLWSQKNPIPPWKFRRLKKIK